MAYWLLKTEPDCYSFADLRREGGATWDGVANALALKNIRSMRKGDEVIIYHTGDERQAVGVARVTSEPYPDPKEKDPKRVVVDLKPVKALKRPVHLEEFKADKAFEGWELLRIGRLSVVPVPDRMWARIEKLAAGGDD